ncbi:MAG: hypothetical protein ACRD0K_03035 [Egibacteraceae bacterium]
MGPDIARRHPVRVLTGHPDGAWRDGRLLAAAIADSTLRLVVVAALPVSTNLVRHVPW